MFNSYLYNTSLFGSGAGSKAIVLGSGSSVVEVVGTLRSPQIKNGRMSATPSVVGSLRLTQTLAMRLSGVNEVAGSCSGHIKTNVFVALQTTPEVVGSCRLTRVQTVSLRGNVEAVATLNASIHHIRSIGQQVIVCEVVGVNGGTDIYAGDTPDQRTALVRGFDRIVFIAGAQGAAGV